MPQEAPKSGSGLPELEKMIFELVFNNEIIHFSKANFVVKFGVPTARHFERAQNCSQIYILICARQLFAT